MRFTPLLLTSLLAPAAFAADEVPTAYTYGMNLDVAEVLSLDEQPHERCQLVPTRMTYRDTHGEVHAISYLKHDVACD